MTDNHRRVRRRRVSDKLLEFVAVVGIVGLIVGAALGIGGIKTVNDVKRTNHRLSLAICRVTDYAQTQGTNALVSAAQESDPKLRAGRTAQAKQLYKLGADMRKLVRTCPPPTATGTAIPTP